MDYEKCWPKRRFGAGLNERDLLHRNGQDALQNLDQHWEVIGQDKDQCFTSLQDVLFCMSWYCDAIQYTFLLERTCGIFLWDWNGFDSDFLSWILVALDFHPQSICPFKLINILIFLGSCLLLILNIICFLSTWCKLNCGNSVLLNFSLICAWSRSFWSFPTKRDFFSSCWAAG